MTNKGLHAYRLLKDRYNSREVTFAEQWEKENNQGHVLEWLMTEPALPERAEVSERDRQVAATVIQWLGSNVGMSFLEEVMGRSPEVARWLNRKV